MNYWKLGCNWGRGMPDFYSLLKEKQIVICGAHPADNIRRQCVSWRYVVNRLPIAGIGLLCLSAAALGAADNLGYSPDGGLVSFGEFDYAYDSASRLTEVWSNGVRVVENEYDAFGRRVIKRTPEATHTFVYDGWLLVVERIVRSGGQLDQIDYWWGKNISGTLDGAGGIGGLLYIRKNGCDVYVPLYDGHGNVMQSGISPVFNPRNGLEA